MSTRDERQLECVKKWVGHRCCGVIEACTGFGKSRTALICITKFINKNPEGSILIIVPTKELKNQWEGLLITNGITNATVAIVNTAVKSNWDIDLLIIDEIHILGSELFSQIFEVVKYKMILGLTATLERLDGKHILIEKHCPIVDRVSVEEALKNNWVSPYKKYKVVLDVDLTEYDTANKEFYDHFSFFNYDFNLAMSCIGAKGYLGREALVKASGAEDKKEYRKIVTAHAFGFMRSLQARKKFIANHPKKVEIANFILAHRAECKALTFSPTIQVAEKIKYGEVLHSKQSKSTRTDVLDKFIESKSGVLNSSKALDVGIDIPDVNLGIILGVNSSKTVSIQRLGRLIRFIPGKEAELFVLVLNNIVETSWFNKSNGVSSYITLDEEGLRNMLEGKDYHVKRNNNMILRLWE